MGSLARKIKRNQMKKGYERFAEEWRNKRADQRENGAPEEQLLGKRPSFNQYTQAVKQAQKQVLENVKKQLAELKKQDEKIDTNWEE